MNRLSRCTSNPRMVEQTSVPEHPANDKFRHVLDPRRILRQGTRKYHFAACQMFVGLWI